MEGNTGKEVLHERKSDTPIFAIEEVGLSNRQVWAATLGELARRANVSRDDLETWLWPASLIGRDGETFVIGASSTVSRDWIATRLLPAEPQSPEELAAMWRERLSAAAVRILEALIEVYPDELDRAALAERAGLTASGGTFGAAVGTLRRYSLAKVKGRRLRASTVLFGWEE